MIMPSQKYLKETVIKAKDYNHSMNEYYHNAPEVMAYRGMDMDGKPLLPPEPERNYGAFINKRGAFVHSMNMLDNFQMDALANALILAKLEGRDLNEYLPYALSIVGVDPDTELSDVQVEYLKQAVEYY